MTERTHWKRLQNKDYLGEHDFESGEEKIVTIASIDTGEVMGDGGLKSTKPIMRFLEDVKPLIVNTTNFKTMQRLFHSKYIEDWLGKQIALYGDPSVKFGREVVGGVRVKKELPVIKETLCSECGQAVTGAGKFTAQQIIQAGMSRYGKAVCMECAEKRRADATPDVEVQDATE